MRRTETSTSPTAKRLLSIPEAADYVSMGKNHCRAWLQEIGAIRSFGGRRIFADRVIIDRVLDSMEVTDEQ